MAIHTIDIPVSLDDLGSEGTAAALDRFIAEFQAQVRTAYPEATVRIYAGSGFSTVYADSPDEERDANDYLAQLAADAQIASLMDDVP